MDWFANWSGEWWGEWFGGTPSTPQPEAPETTGGARPRRWKGQWQPPRRTPRRPEEAPLVPLVVIEEAPEPTRETVDSPSEAAPSAVFTPRQGLPSQSPPRRVSRAPVTSDASFPEDLRIPDGDRRRELDQELVAAALTFLMVEE